MTTTTNGSSAATVAGMVRAIFAGQLKPAAITATLTGTDTIECCGKTTVSNTPILNLCRELIAEGFDPETSLAVYRDGRLAISISAIGAAARLEIGGKGIGFIRIKQSRSVGTASPVRFRSDVSSQPGRAP